MPVKSELKRIRSLQQKKYRNAFGLFLVEGKKTVQELLANDIAPYKIFSTADNFFGVSEELFEKVSASELKQMSQLKNPNGFLGVFHMPEGEKVKTSDWILALDDVQDPGNLGTIIRLCDWFGITDLICSKGTVDCYNPKVLQATMGSIARVRVHYAELSDFLREIELPIYGAFMHGTSVYNCQLPDQGVLVLGNEGKGISEVITNVITDKIGIPQYGSETTESLNVGMAAAILLNEIRRN